MGRLSFLSTHFLVGSGPRESCSAVSPMFVGSFFFFFSPALGVKLSLRNEPTRPHKSLFGFPSNHFPSAHPRVQERSVCLCFSALRQPTALTPGPRKETGGGGLRDLACCGFKGDPKDNQYFGVSEQTPTCLTIESPQRSKKKKPTFKSLNFGLPLKPKNKRFC